MKLKDVAAVMALALATTASAQSVSAHVVVGNTFSYDVSQWQSDMRLAASTGIDAFVLNVATPLSDCSTQVANAFQAAEALGGFKLFFSFDYLGGAGPWPKGDVATLLRTYAGHPSYFQYQGLPLVSTYEGTDNINDWPSIRAAVPSKFFFMPNWTSLSPNGLSQYLNLIDGFFSWDMWSADPSKPVPTTDQSWISVLQGKPYMMGVSPTFYTNLPAYNKAWLFNVDTLWPSRWAQALQIKPQLIQLVTWNDFGESHYFGPIYQKGIPSSSGADATAYVNGMPHDGWRDLLPYYISAYKNGGKAQAVTKERLVYWYRRTPKAAGSSGSVTGGQFCSSQPCYPVLDEVQDAIYVVVLLSQSANTKVCITIGGSAAASYSNLSSGVSVLQIPFAGRTGAVGVRLTRNGQTVLSGTGVTIDSAPSSGNTNFNPWVGSASA